MQTAGNAITSKMTLQAMYPLLCRGVREQINFYKIREVINSDQIRFATELTYVNTFFLPRRATLLMVI